MNKKSFKVTYAAGVQEGVSPRTGNHYRLQEVVLVATDEPLTNADGSPHYATNIVATLRNYDGALKLGDTLSADVSFSIKQYNNRYYNSIEISNINLDKIL